MQEWLLPRKARLNLAGLEKTAQKRTPPKLGFIPGHKGISADPRRFLATRVLRPRKHDWIVRMTAKQTSGKKAADAIEKQLERYREMRDFSITREPSGKSRHTAKPSGQLPFVIQKHAASRLHYDFRLGWNGVLKSWAIAKGPSYNPGDKRLAVQVEDHPIEYGGFEGIIPKGQYGGGTVMLWDEGTWEPQPGHTDVDAGLRDGSLKFTLHGSKLKGNWALIRMGGKAANERKPNWLLIKEHDGLERGAGDPAITEEKPDSAVTGRDLDEIARSDDHVWGAKDASNGGGASRASAAGSPAKKSFQQGDTHTGHDV